MSLQIRIFLGCVFNKEIAIHLKQSNLWNEALVTKESPLMEIEWGEKKYIGIYLPSKISHLELQGKEKEMRSHLQFYCPKLNLDKHTLFLFSQVFIA